MRTRLFLAAVSIFILPFASSLNVGDKLTSATPFASVAYAGHTISGNWCECGSFGCTCDPGENPGGNSATPISDNESSDQGPSSIRAHSRSGFDFGTGALILAFALLVWARLRA